MKDYASDFEGIKGDSIGFRYEYVQHGWSNSVGGHWGCFGLLYVYTNDRTALGKSTIISSF